MFSRMWVAASALFCALVLAVACQKPAPPPWEIDNPIRPLPKAPLGINIDLTKLTNPGRRSAEPVKPEHVRLGRWLFYDRRLSGDGTVACATCHRPEYAFS